MPKDLSLTVEFYGIPRERAGRPQLAVTAGTVGDVLSAVAQQCPRLKDLRQPNGAVSRHYRLSLNGERFLTDIDEILPARACLLILSADAGG